MKTIILLITFFAIVDSTAQTRPANIEVAIAVFDNSGSSDSIQTLICGVDSMATDSIDVLLSEYWILCPWSYGDGDCPPVDNFAAVFDLPTPPPANSLLFGSYKDFRYGTVPFSGTITYKIYYWTRAAATALFISWDFPEGVSGLLQDSFGGLIFNYVMPDSGTFTDPSLLTLGGIGLNLILTYQNVIPVELASFTASILKNEKAVQLNWTTATETNNSSFEILRKAQNDNEWNDIGFVPGFGTTTEPKTYSFTDENVTTGTYNYRLKQIDFDGTFEYSNEIEVVVDFIPNEFVLYQNYPNPFNPSTVISYQLPVNGKVSLKVYDILGNEVATLVNEEKEAGVYEVEFNTSHSGEVRNLTSGISARGGYASGIYFYQLRAGSFAETKKMILLR